MQPSNIALLFSVYIDFSTSCDVMATESVSESSFSADIGALSTADSERESTDLRFGRVAEDICISSVSASPFA